MKPDVDSKAENLDIYLRGVAKRTHKTFYRKNKQGNVSKCAQCVSNSDASTSASIPAHQKIPIGQIENADVSSVIPRRHLLLVDAPIMLYKTDVLDDDIFSHMVIAQTVWEEVKRRNPASYKKMRDLAMGAHAEERGIYVYMNDFSVHTRIAQRNVDDDDSRGHRALRRLAVFYQEHVQQFDDDLAVVLVCDAEPQRDLAREEGITSFTLLEYVNGIASRPELADKLALFESKETTTGAGKLCFDEHLSPVEMQKLLLSDFKQGDFQVNRDNYLEAFVFVHGETEPYFVQGLLNCNRAVHGDTVVIQVLPKDQWSCPAKLLKIRDLEEQQQAATEVTATDGGKEGGGMDTTDDFEESALDELDTIEDQEIAMASSKRLADLLPSVKVVGIVCRNWRPYCGVLLMSHVPGARRHLFSAHDRRIPRIRIETRQAELLKGQRIVVQIDSWPRDSRYPLGHYVRSVGKLGDKDTENEVLLLEHDIPHGAFSRRVLACLPAPDWQIDDEQRMKRADLRHLNVCSVDPPGCTDIDDALHCRRLENGNWEAGVHIADVSQFVRPNTVMDAEAAMRSTTVYLTDRRIDMLPDRLSGNLCSLRQKEERFAFSVFCELNDGAEMIGEPIFCKSIICSQRAFTYQQAQDAIDDKSLDDPLSESLRVLNRLAKCLRRRRKADGALNLASMEIRFNIDSETKDPISVQEKKALETHSMVEEFMLLANITVANKIKSEYADCAVLRRHPTPPVTNYKPVVAAAASRGFSLDVNGGKSLAESLDHAVVSKNPFFNVMLRMLTTRCMTQAVYFASGEVKEDQYYHFGLAAPIYTHFTSPIRRYADLMVHRLLAAAIDADEAFSVLFDRRKVEEQCRNMNYRHKQAQYAGRASVLLNTHRLFSEKLEELEGYILSIRRNAIQIIIPKYGLENQVFLPQKNSPLKYDEEQGTLTCEESGLKLQMFDRVVVQIWLDKTNEQHPRLRLSLVDPKVEGLSVESVLTTCSDELPVEKPLARPTNVHTPPLH